MLYLAVTGILENFITSNFKAFGIFINRVDLHTRAKIQLHRTWPSALGYKPINPRLTKLFFVTPPLDFHNRTPKKHDKVGVIINR